MYDYLDLTCTTPFNEPCIQLGHEQYVKWARLEARVYINQLIAQQGEPPEGVSFQIKSNLHDFGTYYSVCIKYDTEDEIATNYAFDCDNGDYGDWTPSSRKELEEAGYPFEEVM